MGEQQVTSHIPHIAEEYLKVIKHVPKGIEARRHHEPIDQIELAKQYDRVAHETVEVRGVKRSVDEFDPPAPERPTVLENEIAAKVMGSWDSPVHLARKILKIQRIAQALRLLEDHENGLVDIVYPGKD